MEDEKPSRDLGQDLAFDPVRVSEHIESCRAHAANLSGHAHIAAQALHECIEYEPHEPHLGTCMDVAVEMLDQVHAALSPLAIVSHDVDPQTRAAEIYARCETQRRTLNRAQHITLATTYILESSEIDRTDDTDEIIESLREIEGGIRMVIEGLHPAAMSE